MKKYFVDQTGTGEGYVFEAEGVDIHESGNVAIFYANDIDHVSDPILWETEFYNIEVITDEDVEYEPEEETAAQTLLRGIEERETHKCNGHHTWPPCVDKQCWHKDHDGESKAT